MRGKSLSIGIAIMMVLGIAGLGLNPADAADMAFPPEIRASTATMLSGTTIMMMAMAPQFEEILGSKLRAVPSDLLASQCLAMKKGKADFWNVHLGSSYRAVFGVEEYCTPRWGPQRIRMAWIGGPALLTMAVRGNSGIDSIQDLKGKKIGVYAGSEGFISACLAFGNLTMNDVKVVPATGYAGALTQLSENRVDSAFAAISSPVCYEMDESPAGLKFIALPHQDKPAWKRLQRIYPALLPYTVPEKVGVKAGWGVEMLGFPRGNFVYADQKDAIGYAIAKVCAEGYESYKDKHKELKFWTRAAAMDCIKVPTPYHSGSIRYFKEQGWWTPEHEKWQQDQIRLEDLRQAAWKKALAEAKAKGIKTEIDNKQWQDLWRSYLNSIE